MGALLWGLAVGPSVLALDVVHSLVSASVIARMSAWLRKRSRSWWVRIWHCRGLGLGIGPLRSRSRWRC